MKHALAIVLALGLTGAASAADTEQKPVQQDSPMVAAAKRANRKGRKPANVITNATLAKSGSGAHITTTTAQQPFVAPKPYVPPVPTPEMAGQQARDAAKRRDAEEAAKQKKAAEAQKHAAAAAAAASEEGLYDDAEVDPALAGQTEEPADRKPPQR